VDRTDAAGKIVRDRNGRPVRDKVIDEADRPHVVEVARLFLRERWSFRKLVRYANQIRLGWLGPVEQPGVAQLLARETYFGVEYYRKTYQVRNRLTGVVKVVHRPRSEWKRREVPNLRILPEEWRDLLRARLAEIRRRTTGRRSGPRAAPARRGARCTRRPSFAPSASTASRSWPWVGPVTARPTAA